MSSNRQHHCVQLAKEGLWSSKYGEMRRKCSTKNSDICDQTSKLRDPGGKRTSLMRQKHLSRGCRFRQNVKRDRYGAVLKIEMLVLKIEQAF